MDCSIFGKQNNMKRNLTFIEERLKSWHSTISNMDQKPAVLLKSWNENFSPKGEWSE